MGSGSNRTQKCVLSIASFIALALCLLSLSGWLYWRQLKTTPQYSLALLIDAAKSGDSEQINKLVDTDAVVDSMVPQIIEQAAELYGRGLPRGVVNKIALLKTPLLPAVKQRVRSELPIILQREAQPLFDVPFAALVVFADRYLVISTEGKVATVRLRLPNNDLEFSMRQDGDVWRISGVRDDELSRKIAESVGQQMIGLATEGDLKQAAESLGVKDLDGLIKRAEELLRR
jgi:hypothetical protein